jgi:hypothetical protein
MEKLIISGSEDTRPRSTKTTSRSFDSRWDIYIGGQQFRTTFQRRGRRNLRYLQFRLAPSEDSPLAATTQVVVSEKMSSTAYSRLPNLGLARQ